jgi:hypothetical protein
LASNKISKNQFWKNFIPGWNWKYFYFLTLIANLMKRKSQMLHRIKSLFFIFLIFNGLYATAQDTSGIYLTKTDFLNNILQYNTNNNIPTPFLPVFARFVIERDAFPVRIKMPDGQKKTFSPGSFFAFNNDGVKYLYIKESNDYAVFVNDAAPVYMIVQKKVHFSLSTAFADDIYLYTRNLGEPFKVFSSENIIEDFGSNKKAMDLLLELRQKIIKEGYDAEIHKPAFLRCRKMVGIYMDKLKSILDNG